jgi:uncharacterized protein YdhG (YjbR/CyaY superfamily)
MKNMRTEFKTMDEYIESYPLEIQPILEKIRQTVKKAAPEAVETISYGMPSFKLNSKVLVYFAAFKHHIGFYPLPSGITAFAKELTPYPKGKGSIQFPLDKPVPYDLIEKMVQFRVRENHPKKK